VAASHPTFIPLPAPFGPDLKVLVLAGDDSPAAPSRRPGQGTRDVPLPDKSFRPLHGQLVVEYVLDLLRDSGLTRIWLLASAGQLARLPARHQVIGVLQPPEADFAADLTIAAAAVAAGPDEPVLVVFGDHPVQTPAALRVFLTRCRDQIEEADFFHALATRTAYREYGASFRRTSVHTREMSGRASGFSLVVPSRLHRLDALGALYGVRKLEHLRSMAGLTWQLMRSLGRDAPRGVFDAVLGYAAKEMEKAARGTGARGRIAARLEAWCAARVPIRRLERYAARILGAERGVRLIPIAHGGMAIDVDFAEELEVLEREWDAIRRISAEQERRLADRSPESHQMLSSM